ncbi:MAG: tRNA (adenosine(37)-N6)-threonylcarbamoyltransferase complex dimerization subunit type 1 TsaB [Salinivirgaceae bacterium]|nr:tRNA (adenosine(37)-N6)-threonylcarbamoyltransferase complex dimerization subunit type 1 TsaB [Salinivirgaceae bacterium]
MALILNIETSTPVCSASLAENGKLVALKESFEDRSHASLLTVFIDELFKEQNIDAGKLHAVSVSEGPGSYTGLRIGVSVAKGICYAKNIPLIAVNTLQTMALMALQELKDSSVLYCPMIDARRMEVYSALFNSEWVQKRKTIAEIIDENSYKAELAKGKVAFLGNGAQKCIDFINSENALFLNDIYPSAKYMATLAQQAFDRNDFKDVAYFEPFYLKDFVATIPKKKIF